MFVLQRFARPFIPELHRELERVFNGALHADDCGCQTTTSTAPAVNLWEEDEHFVAEVEVPGLSMENLELVVRGEELSIKGQHPDRRDEKVGYHIKERSGGTFVRLLALPAKIDTERVDATLKDGVLKVVLPKAASAKARKIAVQAA
jgi:HSP20 family protein